MTPNRHRKEKGEQDLPELETWLERVVGLRHPDPAPVLHDLDE